MLPRSYGFHVVQEWRYKQNVCDGVQTPSRAGSIVYHFLFILINNEVWLQWINLKIPYHSNKKDFDRQNAPCLLLARLLKWYFWDISIKPATISNEIPITWDFRLPFVRNGGGIDTWMSCRRREHYRWAYRHRGTNPMARGLCHAYSGFVTHTNQQIP